MDLEIDKEENQLSQYNGQVLDNFASNQQNLKHFLYYGKTIRHQATVIIYGQQPNAIIF